MKKYIGCDLHKRYAVFVSIDEKGQKEPPVRVACDRLELREYLKGIEPGTMISVEAGGSWYWFVDLLEECGMDPHLANPVETKKRMPGRNKTDIKDAGGHAMLLLNGSLPEVWIPPAGLRDFRGLLRTRLSLRGHTTALKNRICGALRRYGLYDEGQPSDLFAGRGRLFLSRYVGSLPESTRMATRHEWDLLNQTERHIEELEKQIRLSIGQIGYVRLLKSEPGVGEILSATIYLEIGDVRRFVTCEHLASYAGLTPTVFASGGKCHLGRTSRVSNHYLRWAFVEAAECTVMHKHRYEECHVGKLYSRLRDAKGHGKAVVAVARHLAEASWWILTKKQPYREPAPASMSSSENGSARKAV